jgi:hypothetical protein
MTVTNNTLPAWHYPLTLAQQWEAAKLGSRARRQAMTHDQAGALLVTHFEAMSDQAHAARYFWPAYEGGIMPALGAPWSD